MTRVRRAWLQKHPTPAARDGAFHWYAPAGDAGATDRALQARLAERLAGATAATGPITLWEHAPGRVAWARAFAATAPHDGRHYIGLALAVVEQAGAAPARLLAELAAPVGAPWTPEIPLPPRKPGELDAADLDVAAAARALLDSGRAAIGDAPELPRAIAAIEAVLPAPVTAATRCGAWLAAAPAPAAAARGSTPAARAIAAAAAAWQGEPAGDRVAALIAAAVAAPRSRAATAWRALRELAAATARAPDDLAAAAARETARDVAWLDTLRAWARGRAPASPDALADRAALRAIAWLAIGCHPAPAIAEVRWRALLPAARRGELLATLARRVPALHPVAEVRHA